LKAYAPYAIGTSHSRYNEILLSLVANHRRLLVPKRRQKIPFVRITESRIAREGPLFRKFSAQAKYVANGYLKVIHGQKRVKRDFYRVQDYL
jgi:hypothetical protein